MKHTYILVILIILTSCVSKRKTVSEVVQTKTEEITSETTREERKTISEWIKELSGSIVISEVEYYPPSDTVQPSPQRYGAVKAERKVVVQLDTTEQSVAEVTEVSTSSKVATRDEEVSKVVQSKTEIKTGRGYSTILLITGILVALLLFIYFRRMGFFRRMWPSLFRHKNR